MITENLSTLKIHKLTQEQYDRELAAGNIDETALYLTPDEEIDLTPYATTEYVDNVINEQNESGIVASSKFTDTAIRKWRQVVDSRLSPWYLEATNIKIQRTDFETIEVVSTYSSGGYQPTTETIEVLVGTVTFTDCKYGYMFYDIPEVDGMHFESRCDGKTYEMTNGYTINKNTNSLWESDFKDKTHEIYMVLDEGYAARTTVRGLVYECMSMHDMKIASFDDSADIMYYQSIESDNNVVDILAETQTINGVTFTVEGNSVIANGTATDDIAYFYGTANIYDRVTEDNTKNIVLNNMFVKCNEQIDHNYDFALQAIDGRPGDDALPGYYIIKNNSQFNNIYHPIVKMSGNDATYVNLFFLVKANTTLNNVNVFCSIDMGVYKLKDVVTDVMKSVSGLETVVSNKFDNALTYSNDNAFTISAESQTINGVIFTVNNEDNSVTVNGTATADTGFSLGQHLLTNNKYGAVILDAAEHDTVSGVMAGLDDAAGYSFSYVYEFLHEAAYVKPDSLDYYPYVTLSIKSGTALENYTFKPVIHECKSVHELIQEIDARQYDVDSNIVVDAELSVDSVNPVQNKVITNELHRLVGDTTVSEQIEVANEETLELSKAYTDSQRLGYTDSNIYTFDGNLDGKVYVNDGDMGTFVKVSDNCPNLNTLISIHCLASGQEMELVAADCTVNEADMVNTINYGGMIIAIVFATDMYDDSVLIVEKGLYVFYDAASNSYVAHVEFSEVVHPIDQKYLPEIVATKDYVDSAINNFSSGKTLTEHLTEEMMILSSLQYGDELPETGNPGRIFFKRVSV